MVDMPPVTVSAPANTDQSIKNQLQQMYGSSPVTQALTATTPDIPSGNTAQLIQQLTDPSSVVSAFNPDIPPIAREAAGGSSPYSATENPYTASQNAGKASTPFATPITAPTPSAAAAPSAAAPLPRGDVSFSQNAKAAAPSPAPTIQPSLSFSDLADLSSNIPEGPTSPTSALTKGASPLEAPLSVFRAEQQNIANRSDIESAGKEAEGEVYSSYGKALGDNLRTDRAAFDLAQKRTQDGSNKIQKMIDDAKAQQLDPNGYWNKQGTASRIGKAILWSLGAGLGAGGQGMTKGAAANVTPNLYENAINNDIDAQKTNIANHWKAVSDQFNLNNNDELRELHRQSFEAGSREAGLNLAKIQLQKIAAETSKEDVRVKAQSDIHDLDLRIAQTQQQIAAAKQAAAASNMTRVRSIYDKRQERIDKMTTEIQSKQPYRDISDVRAEVERSLAYSDPELSGTGFQTPEQRYDNQKKSASSEIQQEARALSKMPAYKGASSSDIMQAATDNVAAKYHPWQGGVENTKPNVIPGPNGLIFILNPETGHYDLKTHQVDANGNHLLGQDADTYALRNMHGGLGLPYTEGGGRDMRTPQQRTDDKNADLMMNQFLSQDAAKRLSMNWAERRANVSGTVDNDQVIRDKDTYAFLADKAWTEWAKANDENPADAAGDDKVRLGIRSGVSIGLDDKNRDHFMAQVMPNTFDDEKTVAKKIASLKFMFDSVKSLRAGQPLSPETDTLPKIWDRVDATYAHKAITGNREQTEWTPWSLKAPPIKQQTEEKKAEAAKKALAKERARITEEQNRPKPNEESEGSR